MRICRLPFMLIAVAALLIVPLLCTLSGCSGEFASTLPSPEGAPAGSNTGFNLQPPQGDPITGAVRSQFTIDECPCGQEVREWQPATVTRIIERDTEETSQANVVLNLDRSGSMGGTKIADMKNAADLFVSLMRPTDLTEIMSFSTDFTVDQDFTSDQDALTAAINALSAGGSTNIWGSSIAAIEDLVLLSAPGVKALVIMSDGARSAGPELSAFIPEAQSAGIPVYTIGFAISPGSQAELEMTEAANATGGQYWAAPTQQELEEAFMTISQIVQARYQIFWASSFDPGTCVDVRVTYTGPGGPIEIIRENITISEEGGLPME